MEYILFEDVEKYYGENKVLKKVNLSIKKGEMVTLLGSSGCGKSTMLRCLAGLESINNGKIYLDGKNITNLKTSDRNIGMIFQEYSLFPSMNVYKNISYGLKRRKFPKENVDKAVRDVLKMTELEGKEEKYPSQLSGGEKQRVALARAIVVKPKVLLLDEPLSAIDAKLRKSLQDRIKAIHEEMEMTSIFVTHDQDEAMRISDTIHLMNNGIIKQSGKPQEIYTNPNSVFSASFIGNYNILSKEDTMEILNLERKDFKYLAIRPENIIISNNKENTSSGYFLNGKIEDILRLGNINRYIVKVKKIKFKVDILNSYESILTKKQNVFINFKEKDMIFYE